MKQSTSDSRLGYRFAPGRFLSIPLLAVTCIVLASLALTSVQASAADSTEILLVAGPRSHGYGSHEHYAGLRILEDAIKQSSDASVTVVKGWPSDEQLAAADTIVIYCDGGKRHVAMDHRDQLRKRLADGCGLVCLHYAVEMIPGEPGDDWVEMLGGHFEIDYSVNPHWVAEFESLPDHPVSHGVNPFATDDEWYFHMRFSDQGKVTPILAAVAPEHTMKRPNGHHSGNPHVRKSVAAGDKQTVAWTYDRPDGGRSFGFTGGHYHWNWGNDDCRRLVTNGILWTAGESIPEGGASLGQKPVSINKLLENQDYDQPEKFNAKETADRFHLISSPSANDTSATSVKKKKQTK